MRHFTCVQDVGDLKQALNEAFEIKKDRFQFTELGKNKTLLMIFFNSSLRTRLSTQKAAMNLGMNTMVLDVNQGAWKLETERGVIMDGDKPEHLLEAIPVMGCYCDIIGVRSFARFENKADDYNEKIISEFIQYSGRPVFSMEAATRHPLQSFADLITIEEYKKTARPKVVMTWAPHPKALPQAVPNSFAEWMNATDYEFVITHPEGYELDPKFVGNARVEYDQKKAFEGADFIYAKNWAAYTDPNYGQVLSKDRAWTVDTEKMALTNNAYFMHCLPVRRNMIVTDDVYGTFAKDFKSLMYILPQNTLCVYSFSKYFGATGWRLAVIAAAKENIFDKLIAGESKECLDDLKKRYGSLSLEPGKVPFIDRMVADSRAVALNHTAGLSTPQQIQMSLFALMCLLDTKDVYKKKMQEMISDRLEALWKGTGFKLIKDPMRVGYYSEIDLMLWGKKIYGDDFCNWLKTNYEPLDVVLRLASQTSVVLLNGSGFDGPSWSVRASLANLDENDYLKIGSSLRSILDGYYEEYENSKK